MPFTVKHTSGLNVAETIPPNTDPRILTILFVAEEKALASAKSSLETIDGIVAWREGLKNVLSNPMLREPTYKIQACFERKAKIKERTTIPRARSVNTIVFF